MKSLKCDINGGNILFGALYPKYNSAGLSPCGQVHIPSAPRQATRSQLPSQVPLLCTTWVSTLKNPASRTLKHKDQFAEVVSSPHDSLFSPLGWLGPFLLVLAMYVSFFGPDPLFWVLGSDAHSFFDVFTLMTHVHLKLSMSKMKMVIFLSYISPGLPCLSRWPQHPKVNHVRFLSDFPNLLAIFTAPAGLTSKVSLRSVLPFS